MEKRTFPVMQSSPQDTPPTRIEFDRVQVSRSSDLGTVQSR